MLTLLTNFARLVCGIVEKEIVCFIVKLSQNPPASHEVDGGGDRLPSMAGAHGPRLGWCVLASCLPAKC